MNKITTVVGLLGAGLLGAALGQGCGSAARADGAGGACDCPAPYKPAVDTYEVPKCDQMGAGSSVKVHGLTQADAWRVSAASVGPTGVLSSVSFQITKDGTVALECAGGTVSVLRTQPLP